MLGIVIALLLLGILLLLLEIVFVPGTTIVGVGGIILLAIGIFLAYSSISQQAGHISLGASLAIIILSLVVMLKGKTWQRMALKEEVQGKSIESMEDIVSVGAKGKTISRLNPIGKALFEEKILEVSTTGDFVDQDVEVEVVKIDQNRIKVKTI